jgi:hypothetical protein
MAAIGVVVMAAGVLTLTAPAASAHVATIEASAVCTSTGWTATFTATNDKSYGPATLSGTGTSLDGAYDQGASKVYEVTKSLSDAQASVANGTMTWADFTQSGLGATAQRPADCAPPQPPAQVVPSSSGDKNCATKVVTIHHTVTTTPYKLVDGQWVLDTANAVVTHPADTTRAATEEECATTPPTTPGTVTPVYPAVTPPTCTAPGSMTVPTQPANVVVTRTPTTGNGPGTYHFTYAPSEGFAFPAGTDTARTVTVAPQKTGSSCGEVKGTSSTRGKQAERPAVVAGISNLRAPAAATVPTAVEAGLADTGSRSLLAENLVGGGLMLLVGAGCLFALGRRQHGVDNA